MSVLDAPTRGASTARAAAPVVHPETPPTVARPRHLRVVEPSARRRPRLTPLRALLAGAVVVGGMLAIAVFQSMLVEGQLRIDRLDQEVADEQARYQQLRLQVAQLESPDRIVREAITRLGMVPPEDVVYLTPDAPAATGSSSAPPSDDVAAPDESWEGVKPYLESTP